MNGLIPLLDLSLESLDVLLEGPDDPLQLHLLRLEELDVVRALFDLLLQAAELRKRTAAVRTPGASELIPTLLPQLGTQLSSSRNEEAPSLNIHGLWGVDFVIIVCFLWG